MRVVIEFPDDAVRPGEVAEAIESSETIEVEMPGWGSAFNATIVAVVEPVR